MSGEAEAGIRNDGCLGGWRGISHPARSWFMSGEAEAGIRNDGCLGGWQGDFSPRAVMLCDKRG